MWPSSYMVSGYPQMVDPVERALMMRSYEGYQHHYAGYYQRAAAAAAYHGGYYYPYGYHQPAVSSKEGYEQNNPYATGENKDGAAVYNPYAAPAPGADVAAAAYNPEAAAQYAASPGSYNASHLQNINSYRQFNNNGEAQQEKREIRLFDELGMGRSSDMAATSCAMSDADTVSIKTESRRQSLVEGAENASEENPFQLNLSAEEELPTRDIHEVPRPFKEGESRTVVMQLASDLEQSSTVHSPIMGGGGSRYMNNNNMNMMSPMHFPPPPRIMSNFPPPPNLEAPTTLSLESQILTSNAPPGIDTAPGQYNNTSLPQKYCYDRMSNESVQTNSHGQVVRKVAVQ